MGERERERAKERKGKMLVFLLDCVFEENGGRESEGERNTRNNIGKE